MQLYDFINLVLEVALYKLGFFKTIVILMLVLSYCKSFYVYYLETQR